MEHLSGEDLARLVDEAPTAAEQIHLDCCERCTDEMSALVAQTRQLANLCDPPLPDGVRVRVERQLAVEGLLLSANRGWRVSRGRAVAAGFVLFVIGGASGSLLTQRVAAEPNAPVAAVTSAPYGTVESAVETEAVEPTAQSAPEVTTVEAAANDLEQAEAEYMRAVSRYAELSESGEGLDPLNRLAALEGIMLTTEAALRQAPADPIINNYHLTALGQRDALMRELQIASDEQEWF